MDLVGEVEDSHPEWDPLHLLGPHRDEKTVEVQHLWALRAGHVGPGLADPGPGHVVRPPGEAQHLPREHPGGEEDGQAVAVQLVLGEGLEVVLWAHGAQVGVQNVVVRGFRLDHAQTSHVDTHTVGLTVLVIVLALHEGVELSSVVQHLQDTSLHRPLPNLRVEALVSDEEKAAAPAVPSSSPPLLHQPPPELQSPLLMTPPPSLPVSSDLSPAERFSLSVCLPREDSVDVSIDRSDDSPDISRIDRSNI